MNNISLKFIHQNMINHLKKLDELITADLKQDMNHD